MSLVCIFLLCTTRKLWTWNVECTVPLYVTTGSRASTHNSRVEGSVLRKERESLFLPFFHTPISFPPLNHSLTLTLFHSDAGRESERDDMIEWRRVRKGAPHFGKRIHCRTCEFLAKDRKGGTRLKRGKEAATTLGSVYYYIKKRKTIPKTLHNLTHYLKEHKNSSISVIALNFTHTHTLFAF